ncbi:serine carboxypeptidase-like 47 isoform X1 [Brassica napus]|uniref:serine carboxypeptidase-like 47 isoform X1 n=1 Tax=Brassica napus TaxID=3708 RepID=UPI00207A7A9D|nr:serine carboxypeptidase-like 47 isoform X1 [Brassica napus]
MQVRNFSQLFLVFVVVLSSKQENVNSDPSVDELARHAGYYTLEHSKPARMFYFFFESKNNVTDPVVLWLTGGPGCSGSVALFTENGPFAISENLSLSWNPYSWDKVSNIIYVDQPVGTGFSNISDTSLLRHDETGVSNDLYDFLQAFFKDHPQLQKNDFYITGESYAGHYVPALASRIRSGNKNDEGIPINLKGVAIGNGLTNPEIQYGAYADYALEMKLISQSVHESLKQDYVDCQSSIRICSNLYKHHHFNYIGFGSDLFFKDILILLFSDRDGGLACNSSYYICNQIPEQILSENEGINYYDLRKICVGEMCYDIWNVQTFLNQENVRKALGVGDNKFELCSGNVNDAMVVDWMINIEVKIPALVEDGINLLVYAGEYDLVCNWLGNSRWVEQMNWSGQKEFGSAKTVAFLVDGKEAGLMKNHGPLTFLKVHDAGHMVPMDQPKASLQMLQTWMQGRLSTPTDPQ